MALHPRRLHRALSQSYFLLEHSLHGRKTKLISCTSAPRLLPTPAATTQFMRRPFTSTPTLFRRDGIRPDAVLFEGCDYNHWVITVNVPKDSNITRDQMIETYVNIAAQVFGSVEEAKKRIYALSTYQGFKVECSKETSQKFRSIPAVLFVLPDSFIDPAVKEYKGDKYVNGEIFPQNYSPPSQQNYRQPPPPPQQYYGQPPPPPQQYYGQPPPPQQYYGQPPPPQQYYYGQPPPPQHYYGQAPPPQHYYGQAPPPQQYYYGQPLPPQQNYYGQPPPPQQNYGQPPPPQQNYRQPPPPQQNYGLPPPPQQNYGQPLSLQQNYEQAPLSLQQNYEQAPLQQNYVLPPPPQQNYGLPLSPQQNYEHAPLQQNYGQPPPQQNYGPAPQQNFWQSQQHNPGPPPCQNYASPQQQNYWPPQQHQSYGPPPPQQNYMPNAQGNYGKSPNFLPHANNNPAGPGKRSNTSGHDERILGPSYQGRFNQAESETRSAMGQGNFPRHLQPGQKGLLQEANYEFTVDGSLEPRNYMLNTPGNHGKSPNLPPHRNNNPAGPGKRSNTSGHDERIFVPSYQGRFNQAEPETRSAVGQGNIQSHPQPGQRGLKKLITELSVDGGFEQAEPETHSAVERRNFQSHPQPREREFLEEAKCEFSVDGAFEQAKPETRSAVRQGNFQSHPQPGKKGFLEEANYGFSADGVFEQAEPKTQSAVGQRNSHIPNLDKGDICKKLGTEPETRSAVGQAQPEKRGFLEVANYEYSALDGVLEQVVPPKTRSAVGEGNSHTLNPDEENFFKKMTAKFSLEGVSEQAEPETRSAVGQAQPEKRGFLEVANYEYSALDGVLEQVVPPKNRSAVGQGNSHILNPDEENFFKKLVAKFKLDEFMEQAEPMTQSAVGQRNSHIPNLDKGDICKKLGTEPETLSAVGQAQPEKRGFLEVANYEYSALDGILEQVVPPNTRSAVGEGNSHTLNPDEESFFKKMTAKFSLEGVSEQAEPETRSAVGQAQPEKRGFLEVANYEYSALDGVLEQVVPPKNRSAVGQGNSHILNPDEENFFKKLVAKFKLDEFMEQAEPDTHSAVGQGNL